MTEPIDLTDRSKWATGWQTLNGKVNAEIVKQLSDGRFAVVLTDGDGDQWVGTRFADGKCWRDYEDEYDLIPRPKKHSGFIVFERLPEGGITGTTYAWTVPPNIDGRSEVIAVVPYSFTEGDGLEGVK